MCATESNAIRLPQKLRQPKGKQMSTETKTKLTSRQILEKLDQDPNSWTPEGKAKLNAWLSLWSEFLPKKLRRLGEPLQVLSICVVLPSCGRPSYKVT